MPSKTSISVDMNNGGDIDDVAAEIWQIMVNLGGITVKATFNGQTVYINNGEEPDDVVARYEGLFQ